MLTKILVLSLITGTVALTNYSQSERLKLTNFNPFQSVTQLPTADVATIARNITVRVYVGRDRGSGILIANNDNTYTIITNAHVVDRGETYTIQTPDGMQHTATLVPSENTEQDLAILEFNSSNNYQVATIGNSDSIIKGENAIAAGFPETQNNLSITEGKVVLISEKPLTKGYSIGFSNKTVQGMSGGVLLNSAGEVIAVLGKGKNAILDTAYNYLDGTTPTPSEIATYREVSFAIPIANIANLSPDLAALLPDETETETAQTPYTGIVGRVDNIAEQITVRIATPKLDSHGSGVIIAKDGNTYYVATAGHVLNPDGEYQIVTSDGVTHSLDNQTIDKSSAYDLAIFSFTSEKDYTVATIGNYTVGADEERVVFVSGFPNLTSDPAPTKGARERASLEENASPVRMITGGKVTKKEETSFDILSPINREIPTSPEGLSVGTRFTDNS